MTEAEEPVSRYSVTCPICRTSFRPRQFQWGKRGFHCPACGELLESALGQGNGSALIFYAIMIVIGTSSYFFGYRGLVLILITVFGSLLVFVMGVWLLCYIRPPKVQLCLKSGDTGLRLRDISRRGKDLKASKNRNDS
jgi:hypothetical protein